MEDFARFDAERRDVRTQRDVQAFRRKWFPDKWPQLRMDERTEIAAQAQRNRDEAEAITGYPWAHGTISHAWNLRLVTS